MVQTLPRIFSSYCFEFIHTNTKGVMFDDVAVTANFLLSCQDGFVHIEYYTLLILCSCVDCSRGWRKVKEESSEFTVS